MKLVPFDEWIRSSPGRCTRCGYHPPTQGHGPECTGKDGKR